MEAGLLFFQARCTSACQHILSRFAKYFGIEVPEVRTCVQKSELNSNIAHLLKLYPIVFLVGSASAKRPACAGYIFNTLHILPDSDGEPKGIMKLHGQKKLGYLIESIDQAIVLLPDDPYEVLKMVPDILARIKVKYGLFGKIPKSVYLNYGQKIAEELASLSESC